VEHYRVYADFPQNTDCFLFCNLQALQYAGISRGTHGTPPLSIGGFDTFHRLKSIRDMQKTC